jgi:acyl dehydratase
MHNVCVWSDCLVLRESVVDADRACCAGVSYSESIKPPARAPDKVVDIHVPEHQAQLYRLSGDYNPLHIDPEFATGNGFKKPILHGLCSLGMSCRAVLDAYCDGAADRFKVCTLLCCARAFVGIDCTDQCPLIF